MYLEAVVTRVYRFRISCLKLEADEGLGFRGSCMNLEAVVMRVPFMNLY